MLNNIRDRLNNLIIKNPIISLIIAGSLLTTAYAPFNFWIAGFISFYILLYILMKEQTITKAFAYGFVFGFFYFATSLYWIGISLTVDIDSFLWLMPFAICGIPALLAIYVGLLSITTKSVAKSRLSFGILFAVLWATCEIIRSWIPFEFPWHSIGYTLSNHQNLLQISYYLGLSLTSLFVMLVFVTPIIANRLYTIVICLVLASVWGFGLYRNHTAMNDKYDINLRLVQPCLHEFHMGNEEIKLKNLQKLVAITLKGLKPDVNVIIWPEAALQYTLWSGSRLPNMLGNLLPSESILITGADRVDENALVYNSLAAIDAKGNVLTTYDKVHLVPFGEFIPFRKLLPFMKKITEGIGDFARGTAPQRTELDNTITTAFYPLICYEVLFPLNDSSNSKKWLLNITNDAWFGNSLGPYQHLAMARFKAASEGMSLVRVANNGISAIIGPYGEVYEYLPLNAEGIIDAKLPKSIEFYSNRLLSRYANLILYIISVIVMLACLLERCISSNNAMSD